MANRTHMRLLDGTRKFQTESLKKIFLIHLNNAYSAKSYLVANLPVMAKAASLGDIRNAILEAMDEIKLQMLRLDVIYDLLNEQYRPQKKVAIRALTAEAYPMKKFTNMLSFETDLMLLHHLRTIETIEMAGYGILYELSLFMPDSVLSVLLKQNINSVTETREQYELITKEYLR